jgi:hypothetical protein
LGQAIKKKTADETYLPFKNIFESSGRVCVKLHMDGGNEFKGACRKYLESLNIKLFIMEGDLKAMFVERFNQTLKSMMWREFTFNNDTKYSKQLQDLVFPAAEDKSVDFSAAMMLWRMCLPAKLNELVL